MLSAGVKSHSYSKPLQRVLVDFGAEDAFNRVHAKLKEHYGISIPFSAPREVTVKHAVNIMKLQQERMGRDKKAAKDCVISETDGSMVPIVKTNDKQQDKRKQKTVCYREARLTLAHAKGSISPVFSATFKDVDITGEHIAHCIQRVGLDKQTRIHCVGDGAPWISEQIEKQFGSQATYLIDFYHVCEYLAATAPTCGKEEPKQWLEAQKTLLRESKAQQILTHLKPYMESSKIADVDAPIRTCYRYIDNRLNQLDYKSALDAGLPIGSGEIESAHRYIVQKRLKIQGAWWLEETAESMLALRTHRANNDWEGYWEKVAA